MLGVAGVAGMAGMAGVYVMLCLSMLQYATALSKYTVGSYPRELAFSNIIQTYGI